MTIHASKDGEVGIYKLQPEITDQQIKAYLRNNGMRLAQTRTITEKVSDSLTDRAADIAADLAIRIVSKMVGSLLGMVAPGNDHGEEEAIYDGS